MAEPLRPEQWDHAVSGYNTDAANLGQALGPDTTVLVFLRHYG